MAKPITKASLAPKPKPSVKAPSSAIQGKIKPKAKPIVGQKTEKKKTEAKAIPKIKSKPRPVVEKKTVRKVVKKKLQKESKKIEVKRIEEKLKMAARKPVPRPKPFIPSDIPAKPKSPVVVTPTPEPKKAEKSEEKNSPETSEITKTPKPTETASLAPKPKPSVKAPSSVIQDKIKPKVKPMADKKPEKKKIEVEAIPKIQSKANPVVKKKSVKKVVKKKLPKKKENKKAEAKKQTKEKVELAALKPVPRPVRPRRPISKRPQPQDPLALFRVKPQPRGKPRLPKFDLSDEAADRIAKRSLSDKELEKEEGETISLDTRDFRYASYFAHIKRRIQNAWIWPAEAQLNRGELLLRFKLRKNGTLEEVHLIKSAGIRILDDLAMAAVTKAAPFDPFPEGLERKSITATFVYE